MSDHPNIVTLYRHITTPDGRPVFVLEWCRESLAQQVRRDGPLPGEAVTGVGIKIAAALETAHRHGFLHRYLRPESVLVTQFGEPVLDDFGVAALQAAAAATAGGFDFTSLHAAPEMLEGHHPSAATDVYGLASTMYQLLTGSAPFAAFDNEALASVILRIIRDPVRPLRAEGIPIGLSDLLEAALAKDPGQRPGSALEFAGALVAVEASAGWPRTSYVVWEQGGLASGSAPPDRSSAAAERLTGPVAAPEEPPARPAAAPDPTCAAPTPAPREARPAPASPTPSNPTPPPSQPGPSLAAPAAAPRQVLMPDPTGSLPERPAQAMRTPAPPDPVPMPPRAPTDSGSAPARPVFVDPPARSYNPPDAAAPARPTSVHLETRRFHVGEPTGPAGAGRGQPSTWSPLLIAGLASAALVVVAALLLVFGAL